MKKRFFKLLSADITKIGIVILTFGGIPFFFVHSIWSEILFKVYLLTTFLLFIVINSYWESIKEFWFLKAIIVIILIHSGIVFAIGKINLEFPEIDRLPMATYSALTLLLGVEVLISLRIIESCRPKHNK